MKKILFIIIALSFLSGCGKRETVKVETIESGSLPQKDSVQPESTGTDAATPSGGGGFSSSENGQLSDGRIPVLMYHYIRSVDKDDDLLGYNLSTDPELFKKEMEWLKDAGYSAITPSMAIAGDIPQKPIIITFDDGYIDFYEKAFPILKENGLHAATAIIVDKIDHSGFMMGSQLKEISDSGIELMSHSMTHPNLKESNEKNMMSETKESKEFLEYHYDIRVPFFVYPSGDYNEKIQKNLQEAGYSGAFTTEPGIADFKNNPFGLKRIRIDNRNSFEDFQNKILGSGN